MHRQQPVVHPVLRPSMPDALVCGIYDLMLVKGRPWCWRDVRSVDGEQAGMK